MTVLPRGILHPAAPARPSTGGPCGIHIRHDHQQVDPTTDTVDAPAPNWRILVTPRSRGYTSPVCAHHRTAVTMRDSDDLTTDVTNKRRRRHGVCSISAHSVHTEWRQQRRQDRAHILYHRRHLEKAATWSPQPFHTSPVCMRLRHQHEEAATWSQRPLNTSPVRALQRDDTDGSKNEKAATLSPQPFNTSPVCARRPRRDQHEKAATPPQQPFGTSP